MIDYSFYILISYVSAFIGLIILFLFSYKDFFISKNKIRDLEKKEVNKRQNKIITISFLVAVLCCSIFLILYALRDNVIFFYSPSEIEKKVSNGDIADGSLIRLGGLVLEDSFQRGEDNHVSFVITDLKNEINIAYSGILPDLFREGQGVIAEGYIEIMKFKNKDDILKKQLKFNASNILAKHDENYMPPEVSEALGLEY